MLRVDGSYLYRLGHQINPLVILPRGTIAADVYFAAIVARGAIVPFLTNSVFQVRTCRQEGERLVAMMDELIKSFEQMNESQKNGAFDDYALWSLKDQATRFEHVLLAELGTIDLYYVLKKASYDTPTLIEDGSLAFPVAVQLKAPKAVPDLREATRCLAYELYTACGFHLHRANEAVFRAYWDAVTNGKPRPKNPSMGGYLGELKNLRKGNSKVKAALKELKDLHRNPTIHPEHTLDAHGALALMGIVHAAMTYMLEAIPEPAVSP